MKPIPPEKYAAHVSLLSQMTADEAKSLLAGVAELHGELAVASLRRDAAALFVQERAAREAACDRLHSVPTQRQRRRA